MCLYTHKFIAKMLKSLLCAVDGTYLQGKKEHGKGRQKYECCFFSPFPTIDWYLSKGPRAGAERQDTRPVCSWPWFDPQHFIRNTCNEVQACSQLALQASVNPFILIYIHCMTHYLPPQYHKSHCHIWLVNPLPQILSQSSCLCPEVLPIFFLPSYWPFNSLLNQ